MINVNKAYQFTAFIANKVQGVDYLPPDTWNDALKNGFYQWIQAKYQQYEATQNISDELDEIRVGPTNLTSATNSFTLPSTYMHHDTSYFIFYYMDENDEQTSKKVQIEILSRNAAISRNGSEMEPPSEINPVGYFNDGALVVLPNTIHRIQMLYLRFPLIPWWNYVITSGVPVYAATAGTTGQGHDNPNSGVALGDSTQIEAPEYCLPEIVGYVLKYLGFSIKDEVIAQSFQALQE